MSILRKLKKGLKLVADPRFRPGLLQGVAATIEHRAALQAYGFATVIDIGANRGQFTLLMAALSPDASIVAFEPLIEPYRKLTEVTASRPNIRSVNAAIGPVRATLPMHVARRDDSSSLLPITELQEAIFPGTGHDRTVDVQVAPLADFLDGEPIRRPSLMKIDVQGYELEVLKGVRDRLGQIDVLYVEASFLELYRGQPLAHDVIDALKTEGYRLAGTHNLHRTRDGRPVQADFLFERGVS